MTHQTHSSSPSLVLACLDENMSKRVGNIENEQVSAKSKPVRGLCQLKMKEDCRNQDHPGSTALVNPVRPHPSPNTETGRLLRILPGNTAPEENADQSSSSSSCSPRVREDAASSTHRTVGPGVRLIPVLEAQGDPSIDFQPLSDEGEDVKDDIIRNMCSNFGKDDNKLEKSNE